MGKNLLKIFILTVLIVSLTMVSTSTSSPEPVIAIDPPINSGMPGVTFTVNITIANVTEAESLHGWEFGLNFNSSIINVTNFEQGPFLSAAGPTWFVPYIDNEAGKVGGSSFLLGYPPTGAYGSGILANITFRIKAEGYTPLHFYLTQLRHWNGTDILAINHTSVDGFFSNVHDAAVIDVIPATVQAYPTWTIPLNITVTVMNNAPTPENLTVRAYYENVTAAYEIGTQNVTNLSSGSQLNLTFSWNLTDVGWGLYTTKANVTLTGDVNPANNEFVYSNVTIKIPGDVQGDPEDPDPSVANGHVNRYDYGAFAQAYGYVYPDPRYNVECDFNREEDKADRYDYGILAQNYGKSTPKYP